MLRYEKGVLRPLEKLDLEEGEVLLVRIVGRELVEKVFGPLRVDKNTLEKVLREAEDELGIY